MLKHRNLLKNDLTNLKLKFCKFDIGELKNLLSDLSSGLKSKVDKLVVDKLKPVLVDLKIK